jgi:hypothetical protein
MEGVARDRGPYLFKKVGHPNFVDKNAATITAMEIGLATRKRTSRFSKRYAKFRGARDVTKHV